MRLGTNFVVYIVSSVISGALPLALMPFLTHRLDPDQYGVMATLTTMSLLLWPIVNWSTTSYIGVRYFNTQSDDLPIMFSSVVSIPLVISVSLIFLFAIFRFQIAKILSIPQEWSVMIPVMAAAMFLPQAAQAVSALQNRPIAYAALEIFGAIINFAGTILFVIALNLAWEGRILAAVLASVVLSAFAIVRFRRGRLLVWRLDRSDMRGAVRFGAGATANELAMQALRQGDRVLIVILIGQAAMGKYAVALQWSSIMLTILTAFGRAWSPFLFSALSKKVEGWQTTLVRQTYIVWAALIGMFIAFNIITPLGYHILIDKRYHDSMPSVLWITLGYTFTGIYLTQVDYILYVGRTHLLAIITTANIVINLSLSYVLIKSYGSIGAAMAFSITMGVVLCLIFIVNRKVCPMPWLSGVFR